MMCTLTINLTDEQKAVLKKMAKNYKTSMSQFAKKAILEYLEDLEDARLGEEALKEYYNSGEKAITYEEFKEMFDL